MGLDAHLQKVASLARLAATTVYFVDAAGLDDLLPEPGGRMLPAFEVAWSRSGGAMDLATATGGFTSRFSNTLLPALDRVGSEMRSYYVVGYVPPRPDDGRFRSVKVEVSAAGATARTKKGYLAGSPAAPLKPNDPALAVHLDLDLRIADADHVDSVEDVAFADQPFVEDRDGTALLLGDGIEAKLDLAQR